MRIRKNQVKKRPRSFSSSAIEDENNLKTLTNNSGATNVCDSCWNENNSSKQEVQNSISTIQRRGSSPSQFPKTQLSRLSPPVVRVNSPPNNEDLDEVEKQLGDMLEATIASIESGVQLNPKESPGNKSKFQCGGQLIDIDDENSPLSFFTGSFNYFFRPRKRYNDNLYHQPAQYSSWSSDMYNAEKVAKENDCRRRPSLLNIGRTQSLEPSWTTKQGCTQNSSPARSNFVNASPPLSSEASGYDTEDRIDEYTMMLHSNPDLFLASVRKGCVSSGVQNTIHTPQYSTKRRGSKKPTMKEVGRAKTLEPSWTPESSPTKNRYTILRGNNEYHEVDYNNENRNTFDYNELDTHVIKTHSVPETNNRFVDNINTVCSNDAWAPDIIGTPPRRSELYEEDFNYSPLYSTYGRRFRSKSLAPCIPIETKSPERGNLVQLRKFLSQGNLIGTTAMPIYSRELPPQVLFENTEKRRYMDRYYASIHSRFY